MKRIFSLLFLGWFFFYLLSFSKADAAPINSDVALTPAEGVTLFRSQVRFTKADRSSGGEEIELNQLVMPQVLVHGVKEDFAVFAIFPVIYQELTLETNQDKDTEFTSGIADMVFLAKVRVYREDRYLETTRVALIGGMEAPTGKDRFSSDSFDPILGMVYTQQTELWEWDADVIYKWNTGGGFNSFDTLVYDVAYQHRLFPLQIPEKGVPSYFNVVAEANGFYSAEGSHLVFLSPGLQFVAKTFIVESSIQFPIVRELKDSPEPDFVLTGGFRLQF